MTREYKNFKEYEKAWIDNKKLWLENIHVDPPVFPIIIVEKYKSKIELIKIYIYI